MGNLNKVMLIGRLTRDPEEKTFGNGGKVAHIGFAVNNRKKNQQTGEWEDEPVWIDVKAFNRDTGRKLADLVMGSLRKGMQVFIEGHLVLESWEKDGQKQSKLKVVADNIEFLEPKKDGGSGEGGRSYNTARSSTPSRSSSAPARNNSSYNNEPDPEPPMDDEGGGDIPF